MYLNYVEHLVIRGMHCAFRLVHWAYQVIHSTCSKFRINYYWKWRLPLFRETRSRLSYLKWLVNALFTLRADPNWFKLWCTSSESVNTKSYRNFWSLASGFWTLNRLAYQIFKVFDILFSHCWSTVTLILSSNVVSILQPVVMVAVML